MSRVYRILVCDDEPSVLRALSVALESHGYAVTAAASGEQAVAQAASEPPDVVLLDLGLPGIDGRETIRRLRAFLRETPIIVLSAWDEDQTKVEALDLGADDYVEKPFALPELLARIRVAIRHVQRTTGASVESSRLERGDIQVELAERRAFVRGEEVQLTRTQFDLLVAFARHPGRVLTHRALVGEVWGDENAADPSNLRVFISSLRRVIEPDPGHPERIETVAGVGYRFLPGGD
jgi:two-component system KDP operon response regulator KdpE